MSSNNNNNTFGMWVLIILGVLFVIGSLSGGSSSSSAPSSSPAYSSSPERTYVENRFKQEGYSSADSQKAAEAVLKFHAAQQNRK